MSFLAGSFDKSVFNKNSYKSAIDGSSGGNGYAVVRINPVRPRIGDIEDPEIVGVMNTEEGGFNFDIKSEWRTYGGMASALLPGSTAAVAALGQKANALLNASDLASVGEAYASKLHYQRSNYMTINIPIMVVDWDGEGQPLLCAQLLAYYSLPVYIGNLIDMGDAALESIKDYLYTKKQFDVLNMIESTQYYAKEAVEGIKNLGKASVDAVDNATGGAVTDVSKSTVGQAGSRLGQSVLEDSDDIISLRASPVPLRVQIGEYFDNEDMVLTDINFKFSKEMTKKGPLYANFNLSLSTRKILTKLSDVGLNNLYERNDRFQEAKFV